MQLADGRAARNIRGTGMIQLPTASRTEIKRVPATARWICAECEITLKWICVEVYDDNGEFLYVMCCDCEVTEVV